MEGDELYTTKNNFWLGHYVDAIAEAKAARVRTDALRLERDAYVYRSMCSLGKYTQVLDEIPDSPSTPPVLSAIRILAAYMAADGGATHGMTGTAGMGAVGTAGGVPGGGPAGRYAGGKSEGRDVAVLNLEDLVAALPEDPAVATARVVAAGIFISEGKHEAALKVLRPAAHAQTPAQMEVLATIAQVQLRIDRPDLAEATLKSMQSIDDESTLTLLTSAWLSLALGGEKYKECALTFRDIMDRFGPSIPALVGIAVAYMGMRRFDDAEKALNAVLERDPSHADALINMVALCHHTHRGAEATSRWLPRLQETHPEHPYVKQMDLARGAFDRVAASFGV